MFKENTPLTYILWLILILHLRTKKLVENCEETKKIPG